jgi:hypothetical protein
MHDNPEATEREQELAHEGGRQREEEEMRGQHSSDPDEQQRRARETGPEEE